MNPAASRAQLLIPPATPGGAAQESLQSWIRRLCAFNHLRVSSVLSKLIAHFTGVEATRRGKMNEPFHLLSVGGTVSQVWSAALQQLVGEPQLPTLTWLQILREEPLPSARTTLQWCPDCYDSDARHPHGPYDRLLWTAQEVVVCPLHRRYLVDQCPSCEAAELRVFAANQCSGFCPYCLSWLGNQTPRATSQAVEGHHSWTATCLSEVLHRPMPASGRPPPGEVIDALLEMHFEGVGARMAHALHRPKSTVWHWLAHGLGSMEAQLELSYVFGLPLRALRMGQKVPLRRSTFHADRVGQLANVHAYGRRQARELRADSDLFLTAVRDGAYPELTTIGLVERYMEIDRKVLQRRYPELMADLSETLARRRRDIRQASHSARLDELRQAVAAIERQRGPRAGALSRSRLFAEVAKRVDRVQRHEAEFVWRLANPAPGPVMPGMVR